MTRIVSVPDPVPPAPVGPKFRPDRATQEFWPGDKEGFQPVTPVSGQNDGRFGVLPPFPGDKMAFATLLPSFPGKTTSRFGWRWRRQGKTTVVLPSSRRFRTIKPLLPPCSRRFRPKRRAVSGRNGGGRVKRQPRLDGNGTSPPPPPPFFAKPAKLDQG